MFWKRWLALISLFLLLATKTYAAADSGIVFHFAGAKVDPEIKVIEKNGHKFINFPFLNKYLHISADWNPEANNLYMKLLYDLDIF